jgi:hypothetical protein
MTLPIAARPGVLETLQDAQTTGNGQPLAIPPSVGRHIFYIVGNGAIGAGAITLETAHDPLYAGTWAALVNDLATPTPNPVTVVSNAVVIYTYVGALAAVRARISTTVTTTTVSVYYKGIQQ